MEGKSKKRGSCIPDSRGWHLHGSKTFIQRSEWLWLCRTVADGTCTFPQNLFGCDNRAVAGKVRCVHHLFVQTMNFPLESAWHCELCVLFGTSGLDSLSAMLQRGFQTVPPTPPPLEFHCGGEVSMRTCPRQKLLPQLADDSTVCKQQTYARDRLL